MLPELLQGAHLLAHHLHLRRKLTLQREGFMRGKISDVIMDIDQVVHLPFQESLEGFLSHQTVPFFKST